MEFSKLKINKTKLSENFHEHQNIINIKDINNRIRREFCQETIHKLSDKCLMDEYLKLKLILEKHNIVPDKINLIIQDYVSELELKE